MRISRAQPIYSGKKGTMTRPARKPYTHLPPPSAYRVRRFVSQRNALFTSFPAENSCLLRQKPQKLALFSAKTFSMSQKSCVRASKVRVRKALLARFRLSRACALLSWRDFGFFACAHCVLGAFSTFSRLRIALLARFGLFRACALLSRRVFGLLALAHCSLGAILGFSRVRIARLARFWAFIAARCAAYDFLFARTARILPQGSALRQNHKNSRLFCAFSPFKSTLVRFFREKVGV